MQSIIENYPEPQYAWYVTKASQAIEHYSSVRPTSLSSHDSLVRSGSVSLLLRNHDSFSCPSGGKMIMSARCTSSDSSLTQFAYAD
jgi:hypothetical protein